MKGFLNIESFTCGYGKGFHISNVCLSINRGSFTGIIGPNGSGKTTLFKGVTNELKAKSGSVSIDGKDLGLMSFRERARNIAVVSQFIEPAAITVTDYVLMGRISYSRRFQFLERDSDFDIAYKYMKLTGVYQLRDKYMSELSGGEQQLAGIAKALAQEPSLLLLDEPTSHLDISHQTMILDLIHRLNTELELTVLMIIHDLNMAGEYCSYLVMMNDGCVHSHGAPDEVLTYKNIEDVYKTVVITQQNPLSGKPVVFPISGRVCKPTDTLSI